MNRAVIVGGGFAGLLSARVLADHFEQVLILDRDDIPSLPQLRKGTPQANHLHTLLPGGLEVLENLFPGLTEDLDALGGHRAGPADWYALTPHGKTYRVSRFQPTPIQDNAPLRVQTRALLEHCIRQRVTGLKNVTLRDNSMVTDICAEQNRVTGICLDNGDTINSDLIIDASGRVSRTLRWLGQLGYTQPPVSVVNCDFAYSSCLFKPQPDHPFNEVGFLISAARQGPYIKRGGSLAKIEGDRWLVTLAGRLGDHPPSDADGFMAYINTLNHSQLADLLKYAEPDGEPHQYKFPQSVWRHYEQLEDFPRGLVPIGDALMHVNPGYAQGMASACRQVWALQQTLQTSPADELWRSYFALAAEQVRAPWLFAALSDFSKKGTTGDYPEQEKDAIRQLRILSRQADEGDSAAAQLVDAVFDMRRPLSALML